MPIKNEAKIKNPLIVAIREQLEHRALWMYLLCDEAQKKGLAPQDYAPAAIRRCGLYQGSNPRKKAGGSDSLKGLKVGAQSASLQEALCKEQLPETSLVVFTDINTGVLQLKKGDFDVMAVATGNADAIINSNPDLALAGFNFEVSEEESNNLILLKKGNDELTQKVNEILAKAYAAGKYGEWYAAAEELAGIGVEISYDENGNPITD